MDYVDKKDDFLMECDDEMQSECDTVSDGYEKKQNKEKQKCMKKMCRQ